MNFTSIMIRMMNSLIFDRVYGYQKKEYNFLMLSLTIKKLKY